MKFTNTKENFKDIGKDFVQLGKDIVRLPKSVHEDYVMHTKNSYRLSAEFKKALEVFDAEPTQKNFEVLHASVRTYGDAIAWKGANKGGFDATEADACNA